MHIDIGSKEEVARCMDMITPDAKEQLELFFEVPRIIQDLDSNNFDDIYLSWRRSTKFAPWILTGVFYLSDIDPFPHMHTIIESTFSSILPIKRMTIPTNIKHFGRYSFEGFPMVELFYDGTLQQYNDIDFDPDWKIHSQIKFVVCKDGIINVNNPNEE